MELFKTRCNNYALNNQFNNLSGVISNASLSFSSWGEAQLTHPDFKGALSLEWLAERILTSAKQASITKNQKIWGVRAVVNLLKHADQSDANSYKQSWSFQIVILMTNVRKDLTSCCSSHIHQLRLNQNQLFRETN